MLRRFNGTFVPLLWSMHRNVVVFPQPLGPSNVKNVPDARAKLAPCTPPAGPSPVLGKVFDRRLTSRSASVADMSVPKGRETESSCDPVKGCRDNCHEGYPHQS